ncbi:hypothetical protein Taro_035870 [Colocasia esculenta]|uniref:Cyclin-dependent kinase inhibitor domain-containing protein n=1 Tax=Colocasia esculenta TaxID=4460 RepID=A0A843W6W6_COLES|nr:hypothetical protein [Colocasia esculenta]
MGKFMRKGKLAGEIAVMEFAHQSNSNLGVRTRARTLALQRLERLAPPAPAPSPAVEPGARSYLQLRSRRLEKPLPAASRSRDGNRDGSKSAASEGKDPKPRPATANSGSSSGAKSCSKKGGRAKHELPSSEASLGSKGVQASFGENILELESREDRSVRETTPCSLMRDPEVTVTPGSTTRPRTRTCSNRAQSTRGGKTPTMEEMELFFAGAEQLQQRMFTEKYNFDPVSECPLPGGRYEWIRLDC